jgi:hypothetical protein
LDSRALKWYAPIQQHLRKSFFLIPFFFNPSYKRKLAKKEELSFLAYYMNTTQSQASTNPKPVLHGVRIKQRKVSKRFFLC